MYYTIITIKYIYIYTITCIEQVMRNYLNHRTFNKFVWNLLTFILFLAVIWSCYLSAYI